MAAVCEAGISRISPRLDMIHTVGKPPQLRGSISLLGDKSVSHRALLLNSIAQGISNVSGLSFGEDVVSTMACLRALGVSIQQGEGDGRFRVQGAGGGFQEPEDILDAGNSGTSMRLLSGLLAGQPFLSVLSGDSSLRSRPMGRITEPLRLMGANILGRRNDTLAPLIIRGGDLKGIEYNLPVASAQVKSSIMLGALFANGQTLIHQPARSRDHTELMMRAMGIEVVEDGLSILLKPGQLTALDVNVPGDISSAAFWIVAASCHPDAHITIENTGINPTRCGILEAMDAMGAHITLQNERTEGGEPVADLLVESADLVGAEISGDIIPRIIDEIPVLAVAACFARGTTTIKDAQELRVKESDRIGATVSQLSKLGARIDELPDGMTIHGTGRLTGAECWSDDDHRIAMALGVAGLLADGETVVDGAEAAVISYPTFWDELEQLVGNSGVKAR